MARYGSSSITALSGAGPLQSALSAAMASVSEICERIGTRDDPNRQTWADLSEAIATGTERAAIATGLLHQTAAELGEIEHELATMAALVRRAD